MATGVLRLASRAALCIVLTIGVGLVGCTGGEAPDASAPSAPDPASTPSPPGGDTLSEIRARSRLACVEPSVIQVRAEKLRAGEVSLFKVSRRQ